MKKMIVILLAGLFLTVTGYSQASTLTWSGNSGVLDTIVNTGSETADVEFGVPTVAASIVVKVLKISGTVAGAIDYQGSNDGTNFVTVATDSLTDASANHSYEITTNPPYLYYRVKVTGSGTMSASVKAFAYRRR